MKIQIAILLFLITQLSCSKASNNYEEVLFLLKKKCIKNWIQEKI
jgi:hypothetical protein